MPEYLVINEEAINRERRKIFHHTTLDAKDIATQDIYQYPTVAKLPGLPSLDHWLLIAR